MEEIEAIGSDADIFFSFVFFPLDPAFADSAFDWGAFDWVAPLKFVVEFCSLLGEPNVFPVSGDVFKLGKGDEDVFCPVVEGLVLVSALRPKISFQLIAIGSFEDAVEQSVRCAARLDDDRQNGSPKRVCCCIDAP